MKNEIIITKVEVDRKCFIYNDLMSISFKEIEEEIRKRTNKLDINVYGEYDPRYNIEPVVYLQADFEGYHYRTLLIKRNFKNTPEPYYDWLANNIVHQFAEKFFKCEVNSEK